MIVDAQRNIAPNGRIVHRISHCKHDSRQQRPETHVQKERNLRDYGREHPEIRMPAVFIGEITEDWHEN